MRHDGFGRQRVLSTVVATGLAGALMLSGVSGAGSSTTSTAGEGGPTHGVTPKTIKLGMLVIDYDSVKDFVDFHRGDQQEISEYIIDDINAGGGVLGRRLEAVYKTYSPIPGREPSPLALCTALTEDEEVFAVIGVFIDFTGDGQLCVSREHRTIHIGYELEQTWIDDAPPALMLTSEGTKERSASVLLTLLRKRGTLRGRTVAVLGDQNIEQRISGVIEPGLERLGVESGSTGVITITGVDTSAALAQLDAFIERWKGEDVDTIFLAGSTAASKQFVGRIKDAMPKALLLTDSLASAGLQAADEVKAGTDPNPYEGVLVAYGKTVREHFEHPSPTLRRCMDVYEKRTRERLLGLDEIEPDPDGRTPQLFLAVLEYCNTLHMFTTIAERVGKNLTNTTWRETVDAFGPIELVGHAFASLCKDKYAAADGARLAEWDSTLGNTGGYKPLSKVFEIGGRQCS